MTPRIYGLAGLSYLPGYIPARYAMRATVAGGSPLRPAVSFRSLISSWFREILTCSPLGFFVLGRPGPFFGRFIAQIYSPRKYPENPLRAMGLFSTINPR